jgi:hypothetical protein
VPPAYSYFSFPFEPLNLFLLHYDVPSKKGVEVLRLIAPGTLGGSICISKGKRKLLRSTGDDHG